MVRGAEGFGVSGNIHAVAESRRILDGALNDKCGLPEDWKRMLEDCGGKGVDVLTWVATDQYLVCPSCKGAI
jgi:hypothetical protein